MTMLLAFAPSACLAADSSGYFAVVQTLWTKQATVDDRIAEVEKRLQEVLDKPRAE
jgi:hypothetical protein